MENGSAPPPKRPASKQRASDAGRSPDKRPVAKRSVDTADPRDESGSTSRPATSNGNGTGDAGGSVPPRSTDRGRAGQTSAAKRRRQGAAVVDAPDAPPSNGPTGLPVIVPAEPETSAATATPKTNALSTGTSGASTPSSTPSSTRSVPTVTSTTRSLSSDGPTALVDTPERTAPTPMIVLPSGGPSTEQLPIVGEEVTELMPRRTPTAFQRRRRPRVRRVTRVVRHVDTWSVFKVALVFNAFFYLVCLTAGVLLWQVAYATGTVDNIEKFFEGFGWASFEFKGGEIFHNAWIGGLFVAIGLTGLAVFMATLFNLITDLVGGIRVSVLEEEVVPRNERSLLLRFGRPAATPPEHDVDDDAHASTIDDDGSSPDRSPDRG